MRTESRVFWMPKDIGYEGDYEDAFALDEPRGVAAVADGVSSAIFSRQWADILTRAVIAGPPDVSDESFWPWLSWPMPAPTCAPRHAWTSGCPPPWKARTCS